ncbi:MAG: FAD:protein FMN transferase [Acidobacteriota bacterium]|nr:FAD:protein FMN transferase [Acidobacteriota bacterium]
MEPKGVSRPLLAALCLLVGLTGVALWKTATPGPASMVLSSAPEGIMGTTCRISVVVPVGRQATAREALAAAEAELRRVEALMSTWIDDSEVSRLNRLRAGDTMEVSRETAEVLAAARRLGRETGGGFDVTCRPLVELWRRAGRENRLPSRQAIDAALALVGWKGLRVEGRKVLKVLGGARVDLGGIAKGYGIDRAVGALESAGIGGGLVDVGGDLRLTGEPPGGGPWRVEILDPAGEKVWARLSVPFGRAVCTSGHGLRFVTIAGRRLSHIVDPRRGWPAEASVSVTVIAPSAMEADAWATALAVEGAPGLARLDAVEGVEAMVIEKGPEGLRARLSAGFPAPEPGPGFPPWRRVAGGSVRP